jgi:hypothetical protein
MSAKHKGVAVLSHSILAITDLGGCLGAWESFFLSKKVSKRYKRPEDCLE